MSSEVAIRVDGLSKLYRIGKRERYKALRDTLSDVLTAPMRLAQSLGRSNGHTLRSMDEWIWALKDLSFETRRGEAVGVIGRNGAGKSTLLKVLSRITEPNTGCAEIHGRVATLLEVGTGFHPELTGRENIFLNAAILGMDRRQTKQKFDEIVAYSEVEEFIDTPVKRYSSGMYMKLAFAVAVHLPADILLVDEVLAVGDVAFQRKSLGSMSNAAYQGRTVLFVSHNIAAISRLCKTCIWLDRGHIVQMGPTPRVVSDYLAESSVGGGSIEWSDGLANRGERSLTIDRLAIKNCDNITSSSLEASRPFFVEIAYTIRELLHNCRIGFTLTRIDGTIVCEAYDTDDPRCSGDRVPGSFLVRCRIPSALLASGTYHVGINAGIPDVRNLASDDAVVILTIEDTDPLGPNLRVPRSGVIRPTFTWELPLGDDKLPPRQVSAAGD